MTTQLQAQRAITGHTSVAIESSAGTVAKGAAVTLMWQRSWLVNGESMLRHEYKAFGFNTAGKYVEMLVDSTQLEFVVYMNEIIR